MMQGHLRDGLADRRLAEATHRTFDLW